MATWLYEFLNYADGTVATRLPELTNYNGDPGVIVSGTLRSSVAHFFTAYDRRSVAPPTTDGKIIASVEVEWLLTLGADSWQSVQLIIYADDTTGASGSRNAVVFEQGGNIILENEFGGSPWGTSHTATGVGIHKFEVVADPANTTYQFYVNGTLLGSKTDYSSFRYGSTNHQIGIWLGANDTVRVHRWHVGDFDDGFPSEAPVVKQGSVTGNVAWGPGVIVGVGGQGTGWVDAPGITWGPGVVQGTFPVFVEPFNDPTALDRFGVANFRTDWTPAGQDSNNGHGTDLPDNVRVSAGQLIVETGMQNYGETIVRCNTPWAGTGTIEFDAVGDVLSPEAQVVVLILSQPYEWTSFDGENADGAKGQYGIGYYAKNPLGRSWSNYTQITYEQGGAPGPPNGTYTPGVLQHWVINFNGTHFWLTINGADTNIGTGTPRRIPVPAGFNPVGSWISIGTHNHASIKYSPYIETCTTRYDNLTFNALAPARAAKVPISGAQQFGWNITQRGSGTPITHETTALALGTGATSAWLLFNTGCFGGDNVTTSSRMYYRLNGNVEHAVPFQTTAQTNLTTGSFSIPVALSELVYGINTIQIYGDLIGSISNARYANVEIVVHGGDPSVASRKSRFGSIIPRLIKKGTTTISSMYHGATQVWGGPPIAPTGLAATPGAGQVALTWSAPSGAVRYVVEYRLVKSLTTQYSDQFEDRPDGTAFGAPWSVRTGSAFQINGAKARTVTTSSNGISTCGNLLTTDGYVAADFSMASGAATLALHMRGTSTTATINEVTIELSTAGAWSLVEIINDTRNVRASTGNIYTAGTTVNVRLECTGTTANVFLNNAATPTLTGTLTTLLVGTRVSIRMNRTGTATIDNFVMGNFATGGWRQWSTPTVTNATVTGLASTQPYNFRVAAFSNFGQGDYSSLITATPT